MAINTCVVSGSIKTVGNNPITQTSIKAYITTPFFHTDGTLIVNYQETTEPDANGAWSLTLIETATVSRTMVIRIEYPGGSQDKLVKEYTVIIPNVASATLASLITTNQDGD